MTRPDGILGQGSRFILVGLLNTGFTLLVYQGLLFIMGPKLSYTIAYAIGLVIVSVLQPKVAFRVAKPSAATIGGILAYYIIIYFVGVGLLHVLGTVIENPRISILVVLMIMVPVNFLATRFLSLNRRFANADPES